HFFVFTMVMAGIVLSDQLLLTFVFWELTSVSSYFLSSLESENEIARKNALQALLVTSFGGLFLFAAILGMGNVFESYSITTALLELEKLELSNHANWILICVFVACFTKSAQIPFHFWLQGAIVAPIPASAVLHSAMVKAGIFLLYILKPVFDFHPWWQPTLTLIGAMTFVWGTFWAFAQMDLKKALAGTTTAVLGLLTLILALPGERYHAVFISLLLAHALYKSALFLFVGSIERGTKTGMLTELSGLKYKMPKTAYGLAVGLFSMAGFPPALSFFAKEALLEALEASPWASYLTAAVLLSFSVNAAYCAYLGFKIMYGHQSAKVDQGHETSFFEWVSPWILALLALFSPLAFILMPNAVLAPGNEMHLWSGLSPALLLSLLSFVFAGVFYLIFEAKIVPLVQSTILKLPLEQYYNWSLSSLYDLADGIKRIWQRRGLRFSMSVVLWFSSVVLLWQMNKLLWPSVDFYEVPPSFLDLIVVMALILGTMAVIFAKSEFGKILALAWVGLGISFLYFLGGAPDLALTQFLVEILTTLLFVVVLYKIPKSSGKTLSKALQSQNVLISGIFAFVIGASVWLAVKATPNSDLIQFFGERSWVEARGKNVVNVILVDFRAFDTFGGITVLAIAGLGLAALFMKSSQQLNQKQKQESR
ncbi:MAG: hydrogen gas-evolving membrane-bound hydrogenase subunit E, partial [Pseudobdellovibrionaceae bacterium]